MNPSVSNGYLKADTASEYADLDRATQELSLPPIFVHEDCGAGPKENLVNITCRTSKDVSAGPFDTSASCFHPMLGRIPKASAPRTSYDFRAAG